jgi:uncharacterized SAM-binding protein YcdF (DUF218 family)
MTYLHKILPFVFLPIGFTLLFIVAGLVLKKRALIFFGVIVLWVLSMPFTGDRLMQTMFRGYSRLPVASMPHADAIVVLGGMVDLIEGAPLGEWNGAADRFEGGIELFKARKAPTLIFTAGSVPWIPCRDPEGVLLAKRAILLGVPKGAIRLTEKVVNTAEESIAVGRMLGGLPGPRKIILLVTSAIHMPRALMLFQRTGLQVIPYPVDFVVDQHEPLSLLSFLPAADALQHSERAIHEMIGFAYYRFRN